ncbi:hypothetical protein Palpr_0024 [Paludibacter propionicigenes WB4]|uniref:Uncharacterized protein n=1 Tax=Paludibacter propionicigenes (strain DSM 17365 / JCM 13257 / WB4) TaxID=694427 RepID=E4T0R1_PALPW|nr:hypothetical protein [Paludibacter propionicigenes]ADQ78186.1 hypothetical protein Palpr_0024 [Paludibacter propionicigenes WB4]
MELDELQNIWLQYDRKITDNTQLNKEILKRMLLSKPEKRLNWIKIKAGFNVLSPIILILLIKVMDMKFSLTSGFYIGLSLFLTLFIINYIWNIRYFLLVRKIDFSGAILSIKKQIAELEKYKIKTTKIRYLIMPFAIIGIFFMLIQKPIFNTESIVMFVLIILVYITSIYYTFKYSIAEQFRKLNKEIFEIEELEKK